MGQGLQVPLLSSPSPGLQVRQTPVEPSQVRQFPVQVVQRLMPPLEKVPFVQAVQVPAPLSNPKAGRQELQVPVVVQTVQPMVVQSAHGENPLEKELLLHELQFCPEGYSPAGH